MAHLTPDVLIVAVVIGIVSRVEWSSVRVYAARDERDIAASRACTGDVDATAAVLGNSVGVYLAMAEHGPARIYNHAAPSIIACQIVADDA